MLHGDFTINNIDIKAQKITPKMLIFYLELENNHPDLAGNTER